MWEDSWTQIWTAINQKLENAREVPTKLINQDLQELMKAQKHMGGVRQYASTRHQVKFEVPWKNGKCSRGVDQNHESGYSRSGGNCRNTRVFPTNSILQTHQEEQKYTAKHDIISIFLYLSGNRLKNFPPEQIKKLFAPSGAQKNAFFQLKIKKREIFLIYVSG